MIKKQILFFCFFNNIFYCHSLSSFHPSSQLFFRSGTCICSYFRFVYYFLKVKHWIPGGACPRMGAGMTKPLLMMIVGFCVGFSPMILFELKNQFYNLHVISDYLFISSKQHSGPRLSFFRIDI